VGGTAATLRVVSIRTCFIVSLFIALLGCSSAPRPSPTGPQSEPVSTKLRLASSLWPPFVDTENNPRAAVDLVSTALARAGYIAENEITSLDRVISGLQAGSYDGSSALWRSPEREQFLLYSSAYLENRLMLVGKSGSKVDVASFAELAGKKVGLVADYAYGPELDQAKEPIFVRGTSTDENLRALLRGELDYVVCDALVIHHLAQHYPQQTREKLATGSAPLITRSLHFAVRKDLANAELVIERFNQQLAKMLADGSYHRALNVDWIHADVDGDGKLELVAAGNEIGVEPPRGGYKLASSAGSGEGTSDNDPAHAQIMVKGVAYDSWDAVPEEYKKTPSSAVPNRPGTLRASVFEF
jgi:polar amino acid transport system substrate-binding protein